MSGHRPPGPLVTLAVLCLFATIIAAPVAVFVSSHLKTPVSDRTQRLMRIKTIDAEDHGSSRRHRAKHSAKAERRR